MKQIKIFSGGLVFTRAHETSNVEFEINKWLEQHNLNPDYLKFDIQVSGNIFTVLVTYDTELVK